MWGWMDGGWWWFGALWMAVFWGLVIWGVVALTRRPTRPGEARMVLDERFAHGEIDEAEYRRNRELIDR